MLDREKIKEFTYTLCFFGWVLLVRFDDIAKFDVNVAAILISLVAFQTIQIYSERYIEFFVFNCGTVGQFLNFIFFVLFFTLFTCSRQWNENIIWTE